MRVARRVREGICGKRPAATLAPRPQIYLTRDRVGKAGTTGADDLKTKALGALRRLQKLPQLVRAFFRDPQLRDKALALSIHGDLDSGLCRDVGRCSWLGKIRVSKPSIP